MSNNQREILDCVIRIEIKDWFRKFINETCGPDVQIRYQSNGGHFDVHINVEISGSKTQIDHVAEIIRNASDNTKYTLPWVNEHTYYVAAVIDKDEARNELNRLKDIESDFNYVEAWHNIIGNGLLGFSFRSSISHTTKMKIEEIFERLNRFDPSQFIKFPNIRVPHKQSSNVVGTTVLNAFHGKFLSYLDHEDVFSLELANKRPDGSCYDTALDHDIQKFLRERYPNFYTEENMQHSDLKLFKINEVLCHFIHKYHDSFTRFYVPDILTAGEIQSLSCLPNIEIKYKNIIHIDFKPTNDLETVDFCAIYHCDPNDTYFASYNPKYATENYSIHFRADCSLDPLQCNTEFTDLVLKSQLNCSPQKSNSVLQYLTKHFKAYQNDSTTLVLYEFDLNHVPNEIISSLLVMMRPGGIKFHEMSFNLKTLITILNQSDQNWLDFKKCSIDFDNSEGMSVNSISSLRILRFIDMDIDVNVLSVLKNIELLVIDNCRLVRLKRIVTINMENVNNFRIILSSLNVTAIRSLMVGCVKNLSFQCCDVTPSDHFQNRCLTVRNEIFFKNMNFGIRSLFQIIENCEIQNQLQFLACHFQLENVDCTKCSLKQMKLVFFEVQFNSYTLITILQKLNKESKVHIEYSSISPSAVNPEIGMDLIQLRYVCLYNCRLQTHTLLRILSKMASKTEFWIQVCDLLHSNTKYSNMLINLSEITILDTKINSEDLWSILGIFKDNSEVSFTNCEIAGDCEEFPKINLQKGIRIRIYFENMTVPLLIARPLLQSDCKIDFDNCTLDFMTNELSYISIQSNVTFRNMTFDSSEHYKFLGKLLTSISKIVYVTCHFANCIMPNIMNKTPHECSFIGFKGMNLKIETILWILKNCTSLNELVFDNCKIVWLNPNTVLDTKLKVECLWVNDMNIDVQIFHTFVQNCIKGLTVCIENCKIIPARNKMLYESMKIRRLVLEDVPYSPELLQIFQNLNGQCEVEYRDQLSIQSISDICTKSDVYGNRLILTNQICTESIYFELFAELYRLMALTSEYDTEAEYNLPTDFIPDIQSMSKCRKYNWNQFKIKFVSVNDGTMKLEFLKNGKVIDLFYELNNLSDDSEECVVDYY